MNVNFGAIEKAWGKPKKDIIKVNLDLKGIKNLENYITDLEQSRHVLDELEEYLNKNIEMTKISLKFHKVINNTYEVEKYSRDIDLFQMVLDKIQELKKENENG